MNRIETQLLPGAPIATDGYLRRAVRGLIVGYLIAGAPTPTDCYLRRWAHEEIATATAPPPSFPAQFAGLRVFYSGVVNELSLVAFADRPTGVGGALLIQKGGTIYAVYIVDTTDPNASKVRIRTSTGIKSLRLKT